MAEGVSIQQRRPPLYLLTNVTVVVAAHTPCRWGGGVDEFSSAWLNTEEGASQGAQSCKAYISPRFAFYQTTCISKHRINHCIAIHRLRG